jgi:hypothetical protein
MTINQGLNLQSNFSRALLSGCQFSTIAVVDVAADGAYSTFKWVDQMGRWYPQLNLEIIGKLRHDANLPYLYEGLQKPRDRRRIHNGNVTFSNLSLSAQSTYPLNQRVKREMNRNSTFISMLR